MKEFFRDNVKPLLQSRLYCWLVFFFVVLAYGYFLTNPSISKDNFWTNVGEPCYTMLFQSAGQYRWGWGLICWVPAMFGLNVFTQGILGLVAAFLAGTILVAMLNRCCGKRDFVFSSLFCSALMVYPLVTEFCTYPTGLSVLGFGALESVLAAIAFCLYQESRNRLLLLGSTLLLSLSSSTYEPHLLFFAMLVATFLLVKVVLTGENPEWRFLIMHGITVVFGAIVVKFLVSKVLYVCGSALGLVTPDFMGAGAAMEIVWLTKGVSAGVHQLVHDVVRDFGLRGLTYFSIAVLDASILLWLMGATCLTLKVRNLNILLLTIGVLLSLFAIPVLQGAIVGYRVFLPMAAFLVAFPLYLLQFNRHKVISGSLSVVLLVVMSSYLSMVFIDVCERYSLDKANAIYIVNDINKFRGDDFESPIVIVGRINGDKMKDMYPTVISYNVHAIGRRGAWQDFAVSKDFSNRYYIDGGYGGQGTLLDADEIRVNELYRFLTYISADQFVAPPIDLCNEVARLVAVERKSSFPRNGYIGYIETSVGRVIYVNLGLYI